jgi:hypothetical protein
MPSSSEGSITPSCTVTLMGSPQSKQGASMVMDVAGKSQQTASDSNPHCPNHFCSPATVMRYCVGTLLNGPNEAM